MLLIPAIGDDLFTHGLGGGLSEHHEHLTGHEALGKDIGTGRG